MVFSTAHLQPKRIILIISLTLLLPITLPQAKAQPNPTEALHQEARRQTQSIQQGGQNWPTVATEFFIIHHQSTPPPNTQAIKELDLFVARTLALLEQSGETLKNLHHQKLSYYLCDDQTIAKLTGYQTKGMADLAGRAVISSHFPHFHELAHLLMHLLQETPPSQTHPLVQEGIACLLGGRWGRAPATILYTGWVHQNFGMGELSEVLTQSDFFTFSGGANVAYPIGALLCELVRRQAGWSGVLELNARLSGSVEKVASLQAADVVATIADICQLEQIGATKELFETMDCLWPEYRRCGIAPVDEVPSSAPMSDVSRNNSRIMVWAAGQKRLVKVVAQEFPVYLVSPQTSSNWGQSSLFTDHFPGQEYQGQSYGLRCSPENISLYDYTTNQLIATWVASFTDEMGACGTGVDGLIFKVSEEFTEALASLIIAGTENR